MFENVVTAEKLQCTKWSRSLDGIWVGVRKSPWDIVSHVHTKRLRVLQRQCKHQRLNAIHWLNVNDWFGASAATFTSYLINLGCNPFLEWLAWFIKKSKQFKHSEFANIAKLRPLLIINGPEQYVTGDVDTMLNLRRKRCLKRSVLIIPFCSEYKFLFKCSLHVKNNSTHWHSGFFFGRRWHDAQVQRPTAEQPPDRCERRRSVSSRVRNVQPRGGL